MAGLKLIQLFVQSELLFLVILKVYSSSYKAGFA